MNYSVRRYIHDAMSDTNDFFEQLAGVKYGEDDIEPQLTKANARPLRKNNEGATALAEKEDEDELAFEDAEGHLTIDVFQDDNNIYIESAIAGVDPDNIDVAITPESVSIKGSRKRKEVVKKEDYLYQECFWGNFSRSVILPQEIDADRAQASLKNGVLKIILPKIQRTKSKKVRVKVD